MVRLFEQHRIRETKELEGMWEFRAEGREETCQMPVPGCWEQHPDYTTYRGKGTYTKELFFQTTRNLRLEFKGVSHTADIYLDGEKIAHHYNAFTPFAAVVKGVKAGRHQLQVVVDNGFGEASALHVPNDYYTYGGITRPVMMERVADVYLERVHFTPWQKDGVWMVGMEAQVVNLSSEPVDVMLESFLAERPFGQAVHLEGNASQKIVWEQAFDAVTPWTGENPHLYLWNTVLSVNGVEQDDMIERVGFRTVGVKGSRIYLNGAPIYLKGFNRHEDFATVGCAIPLQLMAHDLDLIQDMGANAVRTCHYPNDERFLDLCDERGIFIWEENHARGLSLEQMQNPHFEQQCEDCIREMIDNHYNHPSIVIWGILNECASDTPKGREMYRKQYEQIKELDTSRPTTSATCRHLRDICLDLPDIVSFNMYSGWYTDSPIEEANREEIDWIKNCGGEDKPIIVSEFGAAAMYGYRDRSRCKWSEERQADLLRESMEIYMRDPDITGVFIWQFADCRVTEEGGWFATRARSHNNKGVVDEYRRPKMAYDVVKEMYHRDHSYE